LQLIFVPCGALMVPEWLIYPFLEKERENTKQTKKSKSFRLFRYFRLFRILLLFS
jgi:hypothetical protein